MAKLKITVLERTFNPEIAEVYGSDGFKAGHGFGPCPNFEDGQVFVLDGLSKPEGFCNWAWADIHGAIRTVAFGGEHGFLKSRGAALVCCTDGMKPVVFKLERIETSEGGPGLRDVPTD
jgi:uncharacterized repeat protein (TIGR04076 family)